MQLSAMIRKGDTNDRGREQKKMEGDYSGRRDGIPTNPRSVGGSCLI